MRIYKKGKTSLVSSILNILGLTAAFAALYIILVQVHHDTATRFMSLQRKKSIKVNTPLI